MRSAVEALVQATLEAEMTQVKGRREGRTDRHPVGVPQRLLQPLG